MRVNIHKAEGKRLREASDKQHLQASLFDPFQRGLVPLSDVFTQCALAGFQDVTQG